MFDILKSISESDGGSSAGAPGALPPVWKGLFLTILCAEHT